MRAFARRAAFAAAILTFAFAGAAAAQENLDSGKTPAQLYAADCAICHKTPNGMSKAAGTFGLQPFLRVHYTASREAAAAIAAYIDAVDKGGSAPEHAAKRTAKPKEKGKPGEAKAAKPETDAKADAKGAKPADKPAETGSTEKKPVEASAEKPAAKPAEKKPEPDKKSD